MKKLLSTLGILFIVFISNAQNTIKLSDLECINNTKWEGTLTYTDYQSGKLVAIDATMQVIIEGDEIIYNVQYTYEPNKNHKGPVKIKKNGTYFGEEKVVSFANNNGAKVLVTNYTGKDDDRKADIYITHTITNSSYTISKEVVYIYTKERSIRNTYKQTKIE